MTVPDHVASMLEQLATVPDGVDVALVIRHAEREDIPGGTFGHDVNLTAEGSQAAEQLGAALSSNRALSVLSSPVPRCVQTAQAILRGTGSTAQVLTDRHLGDPGAFIVDAEAAGPLFLELSIPEIARRQLQDELPLPGMHPTSEGVEILLELATNPLDKKGCLHVFITHDIILSVFVAALYGKYVDEIGWPDFLDGLLLWQREERLHLNWRGLQQTSDLLQRKSG